MRVVNVEEMQKIEKMAIKEFGLDESLIIENVGIRGADFINETFLSDYNFGELVFLIGQGNNGADGLAIARHLKNKGFSVRAFLLFPDSKGTEELQKQISLAHAYGVKITEVTSTEAFSSYFAENQEDYLVVDAILGSGLRLPLSNFLFDVVKIVNSYSSVTIALDIPSGIVAKDGSSAGQAIMSDYTLAVGLPKIGLYIADGITHAGEIYTLDVGLPAQLLEGGNKTLLTAGEIMANYTPRNKFAHKKSFGHSLVVGGSHGLTGALIMASMASLKTGTGLVSSATWQTSYPELASRIIPEIMTGLIPTDEDEVESVLRNLDRYDSIVVGPGLGISEQSRGVVLEILNHYAGPVVVDADAIKVLSLQKDMDVFHNRKGPTIFTPHVGEFARFCNVSKSEVLKRPIELLKEVVDQTNSCIVLKGPCTFLGFPNGEIFINYFPNDGMASGGSGDVLAGILGGLLAQTPIDLNRSQLFANLEKIYNALCTGVSIHTLAGKHAVEKLGARAMTAGAIIEHLSDAFNDLKSWKVERN